MAEMIPLKEIVIEEYKGIEELAKDVNDMQKKIDELQRVCNGLNAAIIFLSREALALNLITNYLEENMAWLE